MSFFNRCEVISVNSIDSIRLQFAKSFTASLTSAQLSSSSSVLAPTSYLNFNFYLQTSSSRSAFIKKTSFLPSYRVMSSDSSNKVHFSSFDVTSQVFYFNPSKSICAFVNLKPILPCHVLVIPKTCYKSFSEVPSAEVAELFQTVQHVSNVLKKELKADALTISIQDGEEAGQSVPHLHVHILPRRKGDFEPNDKIYPLLEKFGHSLSSFQAQRESGGIAPDDEDRKPRSEKEMTEEAEWLRQLM